MTPLFAKLNFKEQKEICLINAPEEFEKEMQPMEEETSFITDLRSCKKAEFVLAFVKSKIEIDRIASAVIKKLEGDAIVWFAYPKKTSKKYSVEIHRDNGWDQLRASGLDSVRAVSISDDWSALRFRKVAYIKK